jgi:ankyrin repeat protein
VKSRFVPLFLCIVELLALQSANASDWRPSYYPSYGRFGISEPSQIISIDMDPQHELNTSFRVAARENRLDNMLESIRKGAAINSVSDQGMSALMYASRNCAPKIVRTLLALHADVNLKDEDGDTALIHATLESCISVVRMLLSAPELRLQERDRSGRDVFDYAKDAAVLDVDGPATQILGLLNKKKEARHEHSHTGR